MIQRAELAIHLSIFGMKFTHVVYSNRYLEGNENDVEERLLTTIAMIKDSNMKEKLEIRDSEMWEPRAGGTMIAVVMNAAYTLALRAVKKMINAPHQIEEFKSLNKVFASIDSKFQNRNLTVSITNEEMKIGFASKEAFENGTAKDTPFSIRYLPVMTVLYNANYRNHRVLEVFRKACQEFNPIKVVQHTVSNLQLSSKEYSSGSIVQNLIALHEDFIADQAAIYTQSISFTECIALSQKTRLASQEPMVISQSLPQFSIALNILRKKYFKKAETISGHDEL
ncbi:unnamed protein product [Auanema sp. JU1783]|nr:unnamed protein product [Auanema sp. JU1783]